TLGCINCKHNLPIYNRWQEKYAAKGLQIIGVHTPETSYEHSIPHVKESIAHWGIKYPVVFDGNSENWNRWKVEAWPSVYVVDKRGQIR
ncbi:redoxin domain-containing protein, partial [Acinetobacter baumannii]